MEPTEETKQTHASSKNNVIIILLIILIIAVISAVVILRGGNEKDDNTLSIGYEADASVMLDESSIQAAMDKAIENAAKSNVALRYVNDAVSTDGINFECRIVNSEANAYDMYLQIFADEALQDEIFLSGLVPPGSGFENITLKHALDFGDTLVYVVLTQVETNESGAQTIVNQVVHTMDFHVVEE